MHQGIHAINVDFSKVVNRNADGYCELGYQHFKHSFPIMFNIQLHQKRLSVWIDCPMSNSPV